MKLALGQLWALPVSVAGVVVALLGGARFHRARAGALFFVARRRGPLASFFAATGVVAFTWGAAIVFVDETAAANEPIVRHELRHFAQTRLFGPLMPLAYMAAGLWAWARGGHWYHDNPFEVDARVIRIPPS